MKTKILSTSKKDILIAAKALSENKLVAFPTETVYGLGANALNRRAVENIFVAKGRPNDNPLIVHISKTEDLNDLVKEIPQKAKFLAKEFWPGPLTMIFKKNDKISKVVTAGLDTIAIRIPSNSIALKLIKESKVPVAAPSANLSTKPSPTSAKHVIQDLDGRVDVIINGEDVDVGLESTVIDMTEEIPIILRPGKVTKEQIEKIIGRVETKTKKGSPAKSPGMKYKHYSPDAKVVIAPKEKFMQLKKKYSDKKIGIILNDNTLENFAKNIFARFREMDKEGVEIILVESISEEGFGSAIMNRLRKAASEIVD